MNLNQYNEACLAWMIVCILWLGDDGAFVDFPVDEHTLDAGLKPGRILFQRLPSIT